MHFKREFTTHELPIALRSGETLQFTYKDPHYTVVTARHPTDDEQKLGYNTDSLLCTVTSEQEPSLDVRAMFESLAGNRLPAGSKKPSEWDNYWNSYIDEDGNIKDNHIVSINLLPPSFQEFS